MYNFCLYSLKTFFLIGGDHSVGVPYVFLTNGSGMTEAQKAEQLQSRLGIYVPPSKVILAHSPLHQYNLPSLHRKILLVGMNKLHDVGTSFGFAKDEFLTPKKLIEQLRALPTERARQELSASSTYIFSSFILKISPIFCFHFSFILTYHSTSYFLLIF